EMSPLERRKARLDAWQNAPVEFVSSEAEANYKERIDRLRKIYDMEPHDRPIADAFMGANEYVARRKGIKGVDIVYHHEKLFEPFVEFHKEFQPDVAVGMLPYPGKSWDILDFQLYVWGGQKLSKNSVIQAVEGEYMKPEEYQDFIADPTAFWLKQYLPRAYPALAPLAMLPDFPRISESVDTIDLLLPFAMPPFQEMLQKLTEAAGELMKVLGEVGKTMGTIAAEGFPSMGLNIVKTPFDYLGDTLRGTKGILMDMFRRPDDLLAACEAYVPVLIKAIVGASDRSGAPAALYVLHKGADAFMSKEQFEKFYWPTWKQVMLGLYEEGITSYLFIEGAYNQRLEYLAEMPEKSLVCHFDQTDMKRVKEVLSDKFIIAGNVPPSLMTAGTVDDVRTYCNDLVELYADAPAYIMAHGCYFENTTDEKMRAFFDSVKN
ncbi:MAG: uroporphyrinogen decarboxylase family protein, partial [Anaerolineales bacterium]